LWYGKKGEIKEKVSASSFADEVDEVRAHIETCLDSSFKESVAYYANKEVEDYETEVADYALDLFKTCILFDQFRTVDVVPESVPEVAVEFQEDSRIVYATLYYTISVEKGTQKEVLEEFSTNVHLSESRCCVPVEVDSSCNAEEEGIYRVCGFLFDVQSGDSLERGGKCVACV